MNRTKVVNLEQGAWAVRGPVRRASTFAANGEVILLGVLAGLLLWVMSITELQLISSALGLGDIHAVNTAARPVEELFGMIILGPVIEELIFRLGAMRLLMRWMPSWIAVIVSAVLFAGSHIRSGIVSAAEVGALADIFSGGIALGAAYLCSETVWVPIAMHVVYNGLTLFLNPVAYSLLGTVGAWYVPLCCVLLLAATAAYALVCVQWDRRRPAGLRAT